MGLHSFPLKKSVCALTVILRWPLDAAVGLPNTPNKSGAATDKQNKTLFLAVTIPTTLLKGITSRCGSEEQSYLVC